MAFEVLGRARIAKGRNKIHLVLPEKMHRKFFLINLLSEFVAQAFLLSIDRHEKAELPLGLHEKWRKYQVRLEWDPSSFILHDKSVTIHELRLEGQTDIRPWPRERLRSGLPLYGNESSREVLRWYLRLLRICIAVAKKHPNASDLEFVRAVGAKMHKTKFKFADGIRLMCRALSLAERECILESRARQVNP